MKKIFVFIILGIFLISFAFAAKMTGSATSDDEKGNSAQINAEDSEDDESEIEIELEDSDEDETEVEVEGNKIKIKTKTMTAEQVKATVQERKRLRINQSGECPEECTCTGSTTKCALENGGREMTIMAGSSGNTIVQVKGIDAETKVELYKSEGKIYGILGDDTLKGTRDLKEIRLMPDQVAEKVRQKLRQQDCECENITLDEDGNYQVQTQKRAKLLGLFQVREKVRLKYDSATGELVRVQNSWWGFLAKDEVEDIVGGCGTVTPGQNDECCQNKGYDSYDLENNECVFVE